MKKVYVIVDDTHAVHGICYDDIVEAEKAEDKMKQCYKGRRQFSILPLQLKPLNE